MSKGLNQNTDKKTMPIFSRLFLSRFFGVLEYKKASKISNGSASASASACVCVCI
jgi:hypothetical protein